MTIEGGQRSALATIDLFESHPELSQSGCLDDSDLVRRLFQYGFAFEIYMTFALLLVSTFLLLLLTVASLFQTCSQV